MIPVLILGKYGHSRLYSINKMTGIFFGIQRQIVNGIGKGGILPDLIARWRKKSNHNTFAGILLTHSFQNWPTLFKFAKGGKMEPDTPVQWLYFLLPAPIYPQVGFGVKKRGEP